MIMSWYCCVICISHDRCKTQDSLLLVTSKWLQGVDQGLCLDLAKAFNNNNIIISTYIFQISIWLYVPCIPPTNVYIMLAWSYLQYSSRTYLGILCIISICFVKHSILVYDDELNYSHSHVSVIWRVGSWLSWLLSFKFFNGVRILIDVCWKPLGIMMMSFSAKILMSCENKGS